MNELNEQNDHVVQVKQKVTSVDSGLGKTSNQNSLEEPIFKVNIPLNHSQLNVSFREGKYAIYHI